MPEEHHIVVNGERVPCGAPVRLWEETGLHFANLVKRVRTQFVVTHWTGSENSADAVFSNMLHTGPKPLSVHFLIDRHAMIYQFCDASAFCAHAQGVNDRSVGIEIVCRGHDGRVDLRGLFRDVVVDQIHGELVTYSAFTPEQTEACVKLVYALCAAYELPMQVPQRRDDVFPTKLPMPNLARFRGVVGHLNVKDTKPDPGLKLLRIIHARGSAMNNA